MKNIKSEIKSVVKKGQVIIGLRKVLAGLLNDNPKLVIISSNCPAERKEEIIYYSRLSETPCEITDIDGAELGSLCGKPFPVSVLGIMDAGESNILNEIN
ncbi:MAG: 50S ribosomal protein L30e [Candidatus Altiarchaeales archaeon ex4484_96]|nr:MAG: 50S ribosomal protein L30e [Candidatus Altiarchaeales archaeon ex4484_96]